MTTKIPAFQALQQYASRYEDTPLGDELQALSARFQDAVTDADKAVTLGDHTSLTNLLRETINSPALRGEQNQEVTAFLQNLQAVIYTAVDETAHTFTAYRPTVRGASVELEMTQAVVSDFGIQSGFWGRDGEFGTYIKKSELERLFGARKTTDDSASLPRIEIIPAQVKTGRVAQAEDLGPDDYVPSTATIRVHSENSRPSHPDFTDVPFRNFMATYAREQMLQGTLSFTAIGHAGRSEIPTVGLALNREAVPTESFRDIRFPETLGGGRENVWGNRVIWTLASELVERGAIEPEQLEGWLSHRDDPAVIDQAVDTVIEMMTYVRLGAYDDVKTVFSGDNWDQGGMRYFLKHGIVALARDSDFDNLLPDYRMEGNLVRTPTGPATLVFDAPIDDHSLRHHDERYPPKSVYLFGLTSMEIALSEKADGMVRDHKPGELTPIPNNRGAGATQFDPLNPALAPLKAMREEFDGLLDGLGAATGDGVSFDADAIAGQRDTLEGFLNVLEPAIETHQAELRTVEIDLMRYDQRQPGMQRWLWDSEQVDALQKRQGETKAWLEEARIIVAGSRLALRKVMAGEQASPQDWTARLQQHRVTPNPADLSGWQTQVVGLLEKQNALTAARRVAHLEFAGASEDLAVFEKETWFFQRWQWMDSIGGYGGAGTLFRQGDADTGALQQRAVGFDAARGRGEVRVAQELHALLMVENPKHQDNNAAYQANFGNYEKILPAYTELDQTFFSTKSALSALNSAESAISHRDWVRMMEPPLTDSHTRYTTDSDGNTQSETYYDSCEHDAWQWRMAAAQAAASSAISTANSRLDALKTKLPNLSQALNRADFRQFGDFGGTFLGRDIDAFSDAISSWATSGWYSVGESEVNDRQREVREVLGKLRTISDTVTPTFHRYENYVMEARRGRRSELLDGRSPGA